jgi:hypothetical protein
MLMHSLRRNAGWCTSQSFAENWDVLSLPHKCLVRNQCYILCHHLSARAHLQFTFTPEKERKSHKSARMSRQNCWSTLSFCCLWVSVMKSWTCVMFRQQCQVSWTLNVKRPAWRLYHQLLSACQICSFLSQVVSAQDEEILELYHYNEGCATKFISHVIRKNSYWKTNLLKIWITFHKDDIADI